MWECLYSMPYIVHYTKKRRNRVPKKIKSAGDFTKASVKTETKEVLKQITDNEGLYEYELIDSLLRKEYPSYFKKRARKTF